MNFVFLFKIHKNLLNLFIKILNETLLNFIKSIKSILRQLLNCLINLTFDIQSFFFDTFELFLSQSYSGSVQLIKSQVLLDLLLKLINWINLKLLHKLLLINQFLLGTLNLRNFLLQNSNQLLFAFDVSFSFAFKNSVHFKNWLKL